jgi:hypothetical protein
MAYGDEDYGQFMQDTESPGSPTLVWDPQQDRNWYTQNLPGGWTTDDSGTIVRDTPFQAAPLTKGEMYGGDLYLNGSGGGGVPYRDQWGNPLPPSQSNLVVHNPDGSWTNQPTVHGGTLYQGTQADYGIPGPGMSSVQLNLPPGSMGGGQGSLYNPIAGGTKATGGGGVAAGGRGSTPYDNMGFSPNWNLADAQEARNKRMETAPPDIFDKMHNFLSPSVTTLAPSQSGEGLPGRGSGSGTGTGEGTTKVTTQSNIMPATAMPTFVRPEVDQAKIESRIQEIMAPSTSALKRTIREAMARRQFSSPTLQKFMMQGAVEGYGNALGQVQSQARSAGTSAYMAQDWQPRWQEAMTNYNAQLQNWMSQIQRQTVTEAL